MAQNWFAQNPLTVLMSPMAMQMVAGSIQMGRYYGLVTHSLAATESRGPDAQAAAERAFALAVSIMAGASLIHHRLSFMGHPHTAERCRNQYAPALFAVGSLSRWLAGPRESLHRKAEKRVADLLARPRQFVSPEIRRELLHLATEEPGR